MKRKLIFLVLLCQSFVLWAGDLASIKRGESIYQSICFACHGVKLEGGTGFNLRDSEWIHGGKREQIAKSIKNGFPDKGMIPFGALYKDEQINDIVNYIVSKQRGLRNLSYEIYHNVPKDSKVDTFKWDQIKANKQGVSKPVFADIDIAEVRDATMVFKGEIIIPEDGEYTFDGLNFADSQLQLLIEGKDVKLNYKRFRVRHYIRNTKHHFKAGNYPFELRFIKGSGNSRMSLEMKKGDDIVLPITIDTYRKLVGQKLIAVAPMALRKRIDGLPSRTIAVAMVDRVNYAFNPANGSINGFWLGDFLDIGPNVIGRGHKGSKAMANFEFNGDQGLDFLVNQQDPNVQYLKYTNYKGPEFFFKANDLQVSIYGKAVGQTIVFDYKVKNLKDETIALRIPKGVQVKSTQGQVKDGILTIEPAYRKHFTITLSK